MNNLSKKLMILGIIFISFNLRAPITSIGSMIDFIKEEYLLTNSMAGFITTLPLIVFALVSPFVSKISNKFGYGKTILIAIITIFVGEIIRSYTNVVGLFVGTSIIGFGIAIGNVVIPSIIKSVFSENVGAVTSIYTTSMCIFAAIGSGVSVPLAQGIGLGWKNTLAIWSLLSLITIIIWIPQVKNKNTIKSSQLDSCVDEKIVVWKSSTAWWVTLFMGVQSLIFYCLVAWLPTIIMSKGMTSEFAGNMALLFQLISIPATLYIPIIAGRLKDQKKIAAYSSFVYLIGMISLFLATNTVSLICSVFFLGVGMGGSISLSIAFISLRSPNATVAADLSGMSQSAGYLLAAVGPMMIGFIVDATGAWTVPLLLFIFLVICLLVCGLQAGKEEVIKMKEITEISVL